MGQIVIVYYSETGNTEAMANMVAKGVEAAGATAKVVPVDGFNAEELKGESAFALGCPAMGDEVLEEGTMEPFVAEARRLHCLVPTDGETVSGCGTGLTR